MSKCSSIVLTVKGLVGFVDAGNTFGYDATVMMSGACPPPAPSVWKVWIVLPLIALIVSSTNPPSFNVSVWIVACTSYLSQIVKQESIADGVDPQSSCNLRPKTPASICSMIASSEEELPLPKIPKFIGKPSKASNIFLMFQAPGVIVVANVPWLGPVPPPTKVVVPPANAVSICCGQM